MPSIDYSSAAKSQHQRRTITIFIDHNLQFIQDSSILRHWLGYPSESIAGVMVTAVFPKLHKFEKNIRLLSLDSDKVLTVTDLEHKVSSETRRFDLQIESALAHPIAVYQITLICQQSHTIETEYIDGKDKNDASEVAKLTQHNRTLGLLNRASRILTATLDVTEVLERLLQVASQIIGAAAASVWLWDDEATNWLVCRAAFHPGSGDRLVDQRVRRGQGIAGWVAETGESAVVGNTNLDQRFTPKIDTSIGFTTASLIAVPLKVRDDIIGVLEVVNKLEGNFENDDLTIAETLAASASIAIDNASLVETMRQQMADLESRNEELDAFDHTVAHNLQNPVALIIGFGDILRQADDLQADQQQQALATIVKNARKMSAIIHELLLLSSVRKSDMNTEPLDTAELVNSALMRLDQKIKETGAEVILPESWPTALGHPGWIEEVWENYISNAIKYGGAPPKLELGSTRQEDGMIQFWIRDNGRGLTEKEQSLLFTPFTRLQKASKSGHGLGLSIVRRIIEKSDGSVGIFSEVEKGSTFYFTLPSDTGQQ